MNKQTEKLRQQQEVTRLRQKEIARTNSVGHADSVEKVLGQISMLSPRDVRYQAGRRKERLLGADVERVVLSPTVFRRFVCVAGCTACCQKFTLDYIPSEVDDAYAFTTQGFETRPVLVNGKKFHVWTNDQNQNPLCDFLTAIRPDGGLGCARWPRPPLACISAPQLQFIQMRPGTTYVLKKPFGRAWAMKPTPQCEFQNVSLEEADLQLNLAILDRFKAWSAYFGIKTCIPQIQKEIGKVLRAGKIPTEGIEVWHR